MEQAGEFAGKSVLVTGAGGGVGSALVKLFSERGARVIGCDTTLEAMTGDDFHARHAFDLLDREGLELAAERIIAELGLPDIVINNAGWTRAETFDGLRQGNIDSEIDLNLTAVAGFSNVMAQAMAARDTAFCLHFLGQRSPAFRKPGLCGCQSRNQCFARGIAVEFGRKGVRANVVCPGSIRTPAWDHRIAQDVSVLDRLQRFYPLGRIVDTREVAETVAFLASDRASGITGAILPVDAGLTAGCRPFIEDILGGN